MIGLFRNKTIKNDLITYNGDFILDNICLKAIVTEELNGDYGIDCTFLINKSFGSEVYENLIEDALLKVDEEYGTEYFRICQVTKNRRDIQVYARHITISDILTMWCEDVRPTDLSGNAAINWIFDGAKGENWFNVSSNISDKASAYYINKNVYQALFDSDNSFLDRWGGEVERRGFNIKINAKIGTDRGVSIRSRKNLLGFEQSTNLNSLATRIYPKGFDGITIEEKYVDSPIIGNYGKIYTREVKFDDVRVNDEEYTEGFKTLKEAQDELKKRVDKMYKEDKVDVVSASYRVDFVQLEKTEEYKNYSIIEKTWLGDIVEVIEENLDVNILVRVTKRSFDVLRDMRTETELSNKDLKIKPPSLGDIIDKIDKIPSQDDTLQKAKENATALINAGLKDSNVIVRKDEILIMDTKDINTAVSVWRWNRGGLGYSSTGYYGQFGLAITNDGAIVADFITTGILNANLIKTGMLKSFNNKTWINMEDGTFNFADKIKFDGKEFNIDSNSIKTSFNSINANVTIDDEGLLINNGMFTIMDAFNKKIFGTDLDGNVTFSGRLQPNDYTLRLFGDECLLDGSANALRRVLKKGIYDSVDSQGYWRLFNQYSQGGTRYASIGYEADGHLSFYNNTSRLKMLYGTAWIQCRNAGDNAFVPITSSNFDVSSKREYKTNIEEPTIDFTNILMSSKIQQYNYKSEVETLSKTRSLESPDLQIGLILEELTEESRQVLHTKGGQGISLYTMISVLWKTCQEQEKRITRLEGGI